MSDITTYPEMNEKIKKILQLDYSDAPALYAAQRIKELESDLAKARAEIETLKSTTPRGLYESLEGARITIRDMLAAQEAKDATIERLREAVIVLHSRDAANKTLPHVLCFYCDLIYGKQALSPSEGTSEPEGTHGGKNVQ